MTDFIDTPDWSDIRQMAQDALTLSETLEDARIVALISPLANAVSLMAAYLEVHEEAIRRLIHTMQTGGRLVTMDEMGSADRLREMIDELPDPIKTTMRNVSRRVGLVPLTLEEIIARDPGSDVPPLSTEILPGPYRIDPGDGNSYRVEYEIPARERPSFRDPNVKTLLSPARVVVTDPFGGHEATVNKSEWETWELDVNPQHIIGGGTNGNPETA